MTTGLPLMTNPLTLLKPATAPSTATVYAKKKKKKKNAVVFFFIFFFIISLKQKICSHSTEFDAQQIIKSVKWHIHNWEGRGGPGYM